MNSRKILFIFTTLLSQHCFSMNFSPTCPEQISVNQQLSTPYIGWQATTIQPKHVLVGISMHSGEPNEMSRLKPDSSSSTRITWYFSKHDRVYIACEYDKTSVQLTQALPENSTTCTVWYNQTVRSDKGYVPEHVNCEYNKPDE